uniref:Uncharacterized protein n=1 Tax=viral metagenome TaxID=1070528 RepID=A0A6C0B9S6_9ZZZZ
MIHSFFQGGLYKEKEKDVYSIRYKNEQPGFIQSIMAVLGEERCTLGGKKILSFTAKTVQPFELFLLEKQKKANFSYNLCLHLLYCLEEQNKYLLKKESACMYCIKVEDILVIDDNTFVIVSPKRVRKIDETKQIIFLAPFERTGFCSPELLLLDKLPCRVTVKTFYYSLGALLVFCISNVHLHSNIDLLLKPIHGTKLYWLILRLLHVEPGKRQFLYV